jgi:hypothetical protein
MMLCFIPCPKNDAHFHLEIVCKGTISRVDCNELPASKINKGLVKQEAGIHVCVCV